jgi:hypothetical protein
MAHIPILFSCVNAALPMPSGESVFVPLGSHWPAEDAVVKQHPNAFTSDPRFGLSFTGAPPAYMQLPPDQPLPVEDATARPGERRPTRRD